MLFGEAMTWYRKWWTNFWLFTQGNKRLSNTTMKFNDLIFFSIKLSNLHYTKKQTAYNIEIKNIYKEITTHAPNLMNLFKSYKVVKITNIR